MSKITPSYGTKVLSKVKIGDTYYQLKDSTLKTIIEGFTKEIVEGKIGDITANDESFVYAKNIKSYVDNLVAAGLVIIPVDELPTASKDTLGKLYLVPHSHEETSDIKDEYITYNKGTEAEPSYEWEKIGNTDIDLSKYITDVSYSNKILSQTKNGVSSTIHEFGAMADANTANGKLSTVDSASFDYTPSGTVNVTLKDSETATTLKSSGTFTPSGSIKGEAISGGSIAVTLGEETTATGKATVSYGSYTPAGTVSTPTITVTPTTANVNVVSVNGTLPSFTAGTFTANVPTKIDTTKFSGGSMTTGAVTFPTLTAASVATKPTATFAKQGLIASVGSGTDEETLILSEASTGSAVTDVTINGGSLNGGSYTAPVLTPASLAEGFYTEGKAASKTDDTFKAGALPTLAEKAVMTGATASSGTISFTGTEALGMKVTGVTYRKPTIASQDFNPVTATLTFNGTEGDVSVTGSYKKQEIASQEFKGTETTGNTVTLKSSEKTVTVKPE